MRGLWGINTTPHVSMIISRTTTELTLQERLGGAEKMLMDLTVH